MSKARTMKQVVIDTNERLDRAEAIAENVFGTKGPNETYWVHDVIVEDDQIDDLMLAQAESVRRFGQEVGRGFEAVAGMFDALFPEAADAE